MVLGSHTGGKVMTKKVKVDDVIRAALPLIENEETWTGGPWDARSRDGYAADPLNPDAVRWSAHGALEKAALDLTSDRSRAIALEARAARSLKMLSGRPLHDINDEEGREAVVALFKKALAA
jgi:hypothetical protein